MKKRKLVCLLLTAAAVLLLLNGCSFGDANAGSVYTIYHKSLSGTSLYEETYKPVSQTFDELMEELLDKFTEVPADESFQSALPEEVEIQGYERGIDVLQIDFSQSYYHMSNIEEVLLRAAVIRTFGQIPGVSKIMITIDAEQLLDEDGNPVPAMSADSFIDTKDGGISSYQYSTLELYFPDEEGTKLRKEVRNVDYSSNMVVERVIVEQLIAGASDPACRTAINPSAKILDISVRNGVCTVNLSEEFNQMPAENAPSAETAIYAVVNSICATAEDVTEVRFSVDGQNNMQFWEEIDLNNTFSMNEDLIESESESSANADANTNINTALAGADQQ